MTFSDVFTLLVVEVMDGITAKCVWSLARGKKKIGLIKTEVCFVSDGLDKRQAGFY
jgi:hypothetical protein